MSSDLEIKIALLEQRIKAVEDDVMNIPFIELGARVLVLEGAHRGMVEKFKEHITNAFVDSDIHIHKDEHTTFAKLKRWRDNIVLSILTLLATATVSWTFVAVWESLKVVAKK